MARRIIITPCTKNKCTKHLPTIPLVAASDYLPANEVAILNNTRAAVLEMPASGYRSDGSQHRAFDLYVRHPKTQLYQDLRKAEFFLALVAALSEKTDGVEWYFLSGGYGVLHALEPARYYQASFSRQEARQEGIPFTGRIWMPVLPKLLDHIFGSSPDSQVYFFGSGDYAKMIEQTKSFHDAPARFKMNKGRSNALAVRKQLRVIVKRLYGFEQSEPSG